MAWKRFPIPEFDYRPLRGLTYQEPEPIPKSEEEALVTAASSGDTSGAGAYPVTPDPGLLEALKFNGDYQQMVLCILPDGATIQGRSMAWHNQRAYLLDANADTAEVVHEWRTPRTHNTRLGPDDGVEAGRNVLYLLSGRILEDEDRGNRIMIDNDWSPEGANGFRILAGCDKGGDNFHDSCFMVRWT